MSKSGTVNHDHFFEDIFFQTFGEFPGPPEPIDETGDDPVLNEQDREQPTLEGEPSTRQQEGGEEKDEDLEKTLGTDTGDIVE